MTSHPTQLQLATLLACLNLAALEQAIRDAQPGQPAATNYDPRGTTGQGPADPTATAATRDARAQRHLADFMRLRDQAYASLLGLVALQDNHLPSHQPRRQTIRAETRGCQLHERAGCEQHHPAAHRTDLGSYLDRPLAKPIDVCEACYQQVRRTGVVPTPDQLKRHDRTGKWTERVNPKSGGFTIEQVTRGWRGDPAA